MIFLNYILQCQEHSWKDKLYSIELELVVVDVCQKVITISNSLL